LLILLAIAGIILIIYLIALARNLLETLKKANVVLDEAHVVTEIASRRAQQVDGVVDDISSSVRAISDSLKGNVSFTKVIAALVNLGTTIKGFGEKTGLFGSGR
jgi:uncharacterized protein YoxC